MKKLFFVTILMVVSFVGAFAQSDISDTIVCSQDTLDIDYIVEPVIEKECCLEDYPHSVGFVYGDIQEVDMRVGIGYILLSDGTMLTIMEPENVDGVENLINCDGFFAVFIVNYRNEVLRVDVVNWE